MRGVLSYTKIWGRISPCKNNRCKGPGVGMSLSGEDAEQEDDGDKSRVRWRCAHRRAGHTGPWRPGHGFD